MADNFKVSGSIISVNGETVAMCSSPEFANFLAAAANGLADLTDIVTRIATEAGGTPAKKASNGKKTNKGRTYSCGNCGEKGHTRKTCKKTEAAASN